MQADGAIKTLRYLPFGDVRRWLYALDPKEAMLLACDPRFKTFLERKRSEPSWMRFINNVRRLWVS
jgi:hypothetical protein